ncbi:MAG: citramalate synthase [Candidatus Omnitrophota bacterium]|nr:citramalate synthase [Candidatus Omnitrophota bacterium]
MNKISIYDTTLRDGSQTEGISYSLQDKINIARRLDSFGIDFIEGGWPYSNPKDRDFFDYFRKHRLKKTQLVPFGSTAHPSGPAHHDKNLKSLVASGTEYVTIFGKTWDLQVKEILRISLDDNLKIITDSIAFLRKSGRKVFYDAEHFFDGYKANPEYAIQTIVAARDAGAHLVIFCDTTGGSLPWDVAHAAREFVSLGVLNSFGIHCHNDLGLAVANSLVVINEGCVHIQGTMNGYGERCGNADLISLLGVLKLKMGRRFCFDKNLAQLTELSHYISEVSNMVHHDSHPFVGRSAFAHKGGIHIDAMLKNPLAYEHCDPALVGNHRRFVVSELAGKSSLVVKARELEFELDKKSARAKKIHTLIQALEHQGYQFEAAEASFKLLLEREFRKYKKFFELLGFRVMVEKRDDKKLVSEATIKVRVKGALRHAAAEGDGPVNALDNALRSALQSFYPTLSKMHLSDFKVRVLDAKEGTAAKVRVLIESQDEKESWTTVGVSENIIEASYDALADSIEYKLLKDSKITMR